jgi:hypothetical protein
MFLLKQLLIPLFLFCYCYVTAEDDTFMERGPHPHPEPQWQLTPEMWLYSFFTIVPPITSQACAAIQALQPR